MTAPSSEKLAQVLHAAGLFDLEKMARDDLFHDYLSPYALPDLELDNELLKVMRNGATEVQRIAAMHIRQRHHDGEFDATLQESDDWAESEDGQDAFNRLARGD